MTKQEKVLWLVQTTILANASNLAATAEVDEYRHLISSVGVFGMMMDALRASEHIPDNYSFAKAADEFTELALWHNNFGGEEPKSHYPWVCDAVQFELNREQRCGEET